ncbi:MAG: hypothetical protein HS122_04655 [Opitutaceae bacterium]|nr:hypothetical protein [Opitutaceae bacterium]
MPLIHGEDIVRAVCTDKWDGERLSPSLFVGEGLSVSRLSLIPLSEHWAMFRDHVEDPPERRLEMIAEINVGHLHQIGLGYTTPTKLTVEPKPEAWNPAHAEIVERITRGLANVILRHLKKHVPPSARDDSSGRPRRDGWTGQEILE